MRVKLLDAWTCFSPQRLCLSLHTKCFFPKITNSFGCVIYSSCPGPISKVSFYFHLIQIQIQCSRKGKKYPEGSHPENILKADSLCLHILIDYQKSLILGLSIRPLYLVLSLNQYDRPGLRQFIRSSNVICMECIDLLLHSKLPLIVKVYISQAL